MPASSNDLIDTASASLARNASTCATIFREINHEPFITPEGRGRHASPKSAQDAAYYLIALLGAEHAKDAQGAIWRYYSLPALSTFKAVSREFGSLRALRERHWLRDGIIALLDCYREGDPIGKVTVTLHGPFPSAEITVGRATVRYEFDREKVLAPINQVAEALQQSAETATAALEKLEPNEATQVLLEIAAFQLVDEEKDRQRGRFASFDGDMSVGATISNRTLAAFGRVLRS
jgi:hypothetical protein